MVRARSLIVLFFAALFASHGCTHGETPHAKSAATASTPTVTTSKAPTGLASIERATVLWISVDGLRGDYVGRAKPAFLSKLAREGQFTTQLVPVFPSLTFPSHLSEATGVAPGEHGITGNAFYDVETKKSYSFPDDAALVQAEPIWITAERQGVRTAVDDWPMSQKQSGPVKSAYFNLGYDSSLSDADRIAKLVQFYHDDHDANPLRLLMGYVHAVDTAGHKFGPDSPLVDDALRETDALLEHVFNDVQHTFDEKAKPGDALYVLITTDHGMLPVKTMVNLETLLGPALPEKTRIVTSGSLGQIYLDEVPEDGRSAAGQKIVDALKDEKILRSWRQSELPPEFHYANPTRTGDVIVMCEPGYTLTSRPGKPRPALPADVKGMHGYDPAECPEMRGFAVLWKSGHPIADGDVHDLGSVSTLQINPTVAGWLGIQPNVKATGKRVRY